jgi:hypothetical protein
MVWKLATGEEVVLHHDTHLRDSLDKLLPEVFRRIRSNNQLSLQADVDLERIVGKTSCVATKDNDTIIFAQRTGCRGLTRFVKFRKSEPCTHVFVVLRKAEEKPPRYALFTAFVGRRGEAEPWDDEYFLKQKEPQAAYQKALRFWEKNALVWESEPIVPNTETEKCPWRPQFL